MNTFAEYVSCGHLTHGTSHFSIFLFFESLGFIVCVPKVPGSQLTLYHGKAPIVRVWCPFSRSAGVCVQYVCVWAYYSVYMYVRVNTNVYICVCICVSRGAPSCAMLLTVYNMCVCIRMYIYMYIYIYIYV
jgi:hypothetical protein